jgi:hypothetical protein
MNALTNLRPVLLLAVTVLAAACGGDDDGGGDPIDAARTDGAATDASSLDGPSVDAPPTPIDAPLVAGEACASPEPVTLIAGLATITGTTLGGSNDHTPGDCQQVNSEGPDDVYSIAVPAGNTLTVTVDPTSGTYDPGVYLIAAPAANCDTEPAVCLASNDAGGDGANDAITFANPAGGQAVDAFIIVDGFRPEGDAYTLTISVLPTP